jgi:syntaxin 1B/2/3
MRSNVRDLQKIDKDMKMPELRMKNAISNALQTKVFRLITWSQRLQIDVRISMEDKIARQIAIFSKQNLSEKQVRDLVNDPAKVEELIKDQIFTGVHIKVKNAADQIKEKLEDIKNLERNVNRLCKMINDLSIIIQKQNEIVNSIEENMKQVQEYLTIGLEKFNEAKENYNKTQAKLCGITVVLIIVMVILMNYLMAKFNII